MAASDTASRGRRQVYSDNDKHVILLDVEDSDDDDEVEDEIPQPIWGKEHRATSRHEIISPARNLTSGGAKQLVEKQQEQGKHFHCYLLRSLNPKHPNKTYVGFTTDPYRRLRQHNGIIKGGARRTSHRHGGQPWEFTVIVHGFPTQVKGLQFEWAWQHVDRSVAVRTMIGSEPSKTLKRRQLSTKGQLLILKTLMTYVVSELMYETNKKKQVPTKQKTKKTTKWGRRRRKGKGKGTKSKQTNDEIDLEAIDENPTEENNVLENSNMEEGDFDEQSDLNLTLFFFEQQFYDLYNNLSCIEPEIDSPPVAASIKTKTGSTSSTSSQKLELASSGSQPSIKIQSVLVASVKDMPFYLDRGKARQHEQEQKSCDQAQEQDVSSCGECEVVSLHKSKTSLFPTSIPQLLPKGDCMSCHRPILQHFDNSNETIIQCKSCFKSIHEICADLYRLEHGNKFRLNDGSTVTDLTVLPCPSCKEKTLFVDFADDDDDSFICTVQNTTSNEDIDDAVSSVSLSSNDDDSSPSDSDCSITTSNTKESNIAKMDEDSTIILMNDDGSSLRTDSSREKKREHTDHQMDGCPRSYSSLHEEETGSCREGLMGMSLASSLDEDSVSTPSYVGTSSDHNAKHANRGSNAVSGKTDQVSVEGTSKNSMITVTKNRLQENSKGTPTSIICIDCSSDDDDEDIKTTNLLNTCGVPDDMSITKDSQSSLCSSWKSSRSSMNSIEGEHTASISTTTIPLRCYPARKTVVTAAAGCSNVVLSRGIHNQRMFHSDENSEVIDLCSP